MELGCQPHAYQAAQARAGLRHEVVKSLTDRAVSRDQISPCRTLPASNRHHNRHHDTQDGRGPASQRRREHTGRARRCLRAASVAGHTAQEHPSRGILKTDKGAAPVRICHWD